jgi:hypothetical protein
VRRPIVLLLALLAAGCSTTEEQREPIEPGRPAEPQSAKLGWHEAYPESGAQLRFVVERLDVRADGWSAVIEVENATAIPFAVETRPLLFGLMLFETGSLEELEESAAAGGLPPLRRATSIEPQPPASLAPAETWRATLSAPGSLPDSAFARVSFGLFVAEGEPPPDMESEIVWITDKAHRL